LKILELIVLKPLGEVLEAKSGSQDSVFYSGVLDLNKAAVFLGVEVVRLADRAVVSFHIGIGLNRLRDVATALAIFIIPLLFVLTERLASRFTRQVHADGPAAAPLEGEA